MSESPTDSQPNSPTVSPLKRPPPSAEGERRTKVRKRVDDAPKRGERIITVKVGEGEAQKAFSVHQNLLVKHSEFFDAALTRGEWKEQRDGIVTSTEWDVEAFDIFQDFIYTGSVYSAREGDVDDSDPTWDQEYTRFQRCWLLGEKLMSTSFKDATTDALICKIREERQHPTGLYEPVYSGLSPSTPIRKLLVDIAIWGWAREEMLAFTQQEDKNVEFLCDLAVKLHELGKEGGSQNNYRPYLTENTCIYHEHVAEKKPCYRTIF